MVRADPNDVMARIQLAEIYEKSNALDKAAAAYAEALKSNPKLPSVMLKLAQLYAGPLNNAQKALEFAKNARDLAPGDPQVAGLLGRIAFHSGNFPWAYSLLQESVRQFGDDASVLHDFAWAAYSLGKIEQAQNAMQKLVTLSATAPETTDARDFLKMLSLEPKPQDAVAAEAEINKVLADHPDYVPALMARAAAQIQRNQSKSAAETLRHVLRVFPDFAPAQKRLAELQLGNP